MELFVKSGRPEKQRTDCLVVGIFEPRRLSPEAERLDKASHNAISALLRRGDCEGKLGQTLLLHNLPALSAERVLLVGCGKEREFNDAAFQTVIQTTVHTLQDTGSLDAICCLTELTVKGRDTLWNIRQAALTALNTLYRFDTFKTDVTPPRRPLKKFTFTLPSRKNLGLAEKSLQEGIAISGGMSLAKNLGNTPANVCTPSYLSTQASALADKNTRLSVNILNEKDMKSFGMGALLSVTAASNEPAHLIILHYKGARKDKKPIVLVGKGITFDTGGNSLKQPLSMIGMKYDMCGAATVLGVLQAAAELALPLNIIGIIPTCENRIGSRATFPGDIVTSMSGKTIEILNTDAEGRLILCDALTYAERFHPDVVIDIATLTGSCVATFGHVISGLFSNHTPLAHDLLHAGQVADDLAWQLPLLEDYQKFLKSPSADMANIGGPNAGSITAACFLSRFAEKFHWAHLDVAGTACEFSGDKAGATGRPIPLLVHYLLSKVDTQ
jgi:leucyl aminopeptidase